MGACQLCVASEIDTPDFAVKALAMEAKARSLGVGGQLKYACPWQCLGSLDTIVEQGGAALGTQMVFDLHTSTPLPGMFGLPGLVASGLPDAISQLSEAGVEARVGWWETNTKQLHDMSRALMEAVDANALDRDATRYRMDTRTASFCTEISGHDDLWISGRGDQVRRRRRRAPMAVQCS